MNKDDYNIQDFITCEIPGEAFLIKCLQQTIRFTVNNRTIKQGKLLLFCKAHYYIQISLATDKNPRENFEIPFPFQTEIYENEGLMYFDYRLSSLGTSVVPKPVKKISSTYFDKILEMQLLPVSTCS
jgi:hypothetical protein